ncbi:hypothetical protein D3C80_1036510 [compost metagenome]
MGGEAVGIAGLLDEGAVDAAVRVITAQLLDRLGIPAGMHQAEAFGVDEQRQLVEPGEEVMPVARIVLELRQGFANQPFVTRVVLAGKLTAAARQCRRGPAEGIPFVVAHQAQRLAGLDHVVNQVQCLADVRATVEDVAEEQRHALRMTPDAPLTTIAEAGQQALEGTRTAMHVANQVVAARRVKQH